MHIGVILVFQSEIRKTTVPSMSPGYQWPCLNCHSSCC